MQVAELPRWDMDVVFPGLDSDVFKREFDWVVAGIGGLEVIFDQLDVREGGSATVGDLDTVFSVANDLLERMGTLFTYVGCIVTANTRDERARAVESELDAPLALLRKLQKRLTAWLGGLDLQEALTVSEAARKHEYTLLKAQEGACHLLSPVEESLVSDLELTGGMAWGKLYNTVTSQIEVRLEIDGQSQSLPISAVRALAADPDRRTRELAYEAELAAWKDHEVPIAAALNGIKGETLLLATKRKWSSPLAETCFHANIDEGTLDAMMTAARESYPDLRRYLHAKARALGLQRLAFYDLFAPLPTASRRWEWEEATVFVAEQFDRYSPKMGDLARRSYAERWLDAEPRPGKVDGAYCAPLRRDESRILMNFKPTFDSVRTLAHELGHAYHCLCLDGRTPYQRETPMTLAETASIFCETIVKNAVLDHGTDAERLAVLEASLSGACQVVVDISSRFLFEQSVYDLRKRREIAPREFGEFMLQAQRDTYGDGLDENLLHRYMWAAKPHYYGASFYNFPYMFGLLFALGLYAEYRNKPEGFKARYDDLLSRTGLADAATLAADFGIDIRTPDFWRASFDQIRADVDAFEKLV
ncbi:MAG: M3 family oligoendopeptidase [Fimbriimonas sp.]